MEEGLLKTIQENRNILVLSERGFAEQLYLYLKKDELCEIVYASIPETTNIENISQNKKYILLFDKFGEDGRFENIYQRFGLDRYDAKIIIVCHPSVISQYRDPSLFFVPIKNGKLQKKLFIQYKLSDVDNRNTIQTSSQLLLKKEMLPKKDEISKKPLRDYYLNKKLMTQDIFMMKCLADRVQESEDFKNYLFKLIYVSRTDKDMQIAAANAISILNASQIPFISLDFSGINIPYANLTGVICHKVSFKDSNLKGVIFKGANLLDVDFSHADMEEVNFDELPKLGDGKIYRSIYTTPHCLDQFSAKFGYKNQS